MDPQRRGQAGGWRVQVVIAVLSVALVGGAALVLHSSQTATHRGVEDRFEAKAGLSADFVGTYVDQLTTREQQVAARTLTRPDPTGAFASDMAGFGFRAGLVLDSDGRILSIAPTAPQFLGKPYNTKYAHLTIALQGRVAVSNVVKSVVRATPVVAFAVPFQTPQGLRVFSGAYPVTDTPLSAFLKDATTLKGARLYIVDGNNTVVASNGAPLTSSRSLAQRSPALARAAAGATHGDYTSASTKYYFATAPIPGTPWTLLSAAPSSQLFISINGKAHWLPWLILAVLSLLIGIAAWLSIRLLVGRRKQAELVDQLATIARTDSLTGLSNRLYLTEQLEVALANASRYGFALTVLMIDIDHFKKLNDTFGHQGGDEALRRVAERLKATLREGDLLARWGGEEFVAVLPHTGILEGFEVAERLRRLVGDTPIEIDVVREPVLIHASVGIAEATDDGLLGLLHRADIGLYAAKDAGRNTVRHASPTPELAERLSAAPR